MIGSPMAAPDVNEMSAASSIAVPALVARWNGARRRRNIAIGLTLGILIVAAWEFAVLVPLMQPAAWGVDFHLYRDAASSWLAGDGFYHARQLAGPYTIAAGDILYPPTILWLLLPFTVLPDVLWWAIPAALTAWAIRRLRPAPWVWPLAVLPFAVPDDLGAVVHGNPIIWIAALTWLGAAYGWGGALVWLKPSLFPFALVGIWRRRWWVACAALAAVSLPFAPLPFAPLLVQYPRVVLDSQDGGLLYALAHGWFLVAPLAVYASRLNQSTST